MGDYYARGFTMILQLHDYAAKAKPYAKVLDAVCVDLGYSQLAAFTQIAAESGWDEMAQSPVGAIGLCQIMPGTAADWLCDPRDPASSIKALVGHMHGYLHEFDGDLGLALAAYNAGPGSIVDDKMPNYPETVNYVETIMWTIGASAPYWPAFWKELLA